MPRITGLSLQDRARLALQDARVRLEELIEQLNKRLGPIEPGEPPAELLDKLRSVAGLRSG